MVKNPAVNAGDPGDKGLDPRLGGRSPGKGNGNPLNILAWEIPGRLRPWGHKESIRTEQVSLKDV